MLTLFAPARIGSSSSYPASIATYLPFLQNINRNLTIQLPNVRRRTPAPRLVTPSFSSPIKSCGSETTCTVRSLNHIKFDLMVTAFATILGTPIVHLESTWTPFLSLSYHADQTSFLNRGSHGLGTLAPSHRSVNRFDMEPGRSAHAQTTLCVNDECCRLHITRFAGYMVRLHNTLVCYLTHL